MRAIFFWEIFQTNIKWQKWWCRMFLPALAIVTGVISGAFSCSSQGEKPIQETVIPGSSTQFIAPPVPGAERMDEYISYLRNRNVALVVNHTSLVKGIHLADTLLSLTINVKKVFAPEHGFRGTADAGETIAGGKDNATGLPVISLYGDKKKPSKEDLADVDLVIFDIQDVGARFYTYISTMHYVMEACAENNIELIVFDRPNPNGHYVDGPVLEEGYQSFVGMHKVPVVHGMTVAEYARMINDEGWLAGGKRCKLKYIICGNYNHKVKYEPPVRPSPNLPELKSIYMYPTTCFFEGTVMSVGRGTPFPFQVYGHPDYPLKHFSFVPKGMPGAKNPLFEGKVCYGERPYADDPEKIMDMMGLHIEWIADCYEKMGRPENFFTPFFTKLAGTTKLEAQIKEGILPDKIMDSWEGDIAKFKEVRKKYLLYSDFE